jgi:hypothetical protein
MADRPGAAKWAEALALWGDGDIVAARQALIEAAFLDPLALFDLGRFHEEQGDLKEAVAAFQQYAREHRNAPDKGIRAAVAYAVERVAALNPSIEASHRTAASVAAPNSTSWAETFDRRFADAVEQAQQGHVAAASESFAVASMASPSADPVAQAKLHYEAAHFFDEVGRITAAAHAERFRRLVGGNTTYAEQTVEMTQILSNWDRHQIRVEAPPDHHSGTDFYVGFWDTTDLEVLVTPMRPERSASHLQITSRPAGGPDGFIFDFGFEQQLRGVARVSHQWPSDDRWVSTVETLEPCPSFREEKWNALRPELGTQWEADRLVTMILTLSVNRGSQPLDPNDLDAPLIQFEELDNFVPLLPIFVNVSGATVDLRVTEKP